MDLYLKDKVDETGNALKVIHEEVNSRWEVCLTLSEKGFQQVSFVNSIATTKVILSLLYSHSLHILCYWHCVLFHWKHLELFGPVFP